MVKLSVCIEMFWRELPFQERIQHVADLGLPAFEFWGWRNKDLDAIEKAMGTTGLPLAAICLDPGQSLLKRNFRAELLDGMRQTAQVATRLGCPTLIATVGNTLDDETYEMPRRRVVASLKAIAPIAEEHGLTIVLEPLNTLVDHHGYWLRTMAQAADLVEEVNSPSIKILMDLYHQQIQEGNLIQRLTTYAHLIGHFHCAGVPGRHELSRGELNYASIFAAIDATHYSGYVGMEYSPLDPPDASLREALTLFG